MRPSGGHREPLVPAELAANVDAFRAEREEESWVPVSLSDAVQVRLTEALSARVRRRQEPRRRP